MKRQKKRICTGTRQAGKQIGLYLRKIGISCLVGCGYRHGKAIAAVFAVAALTPLKTVKPFVLRVDNTTGIVDVVAGLENAKNRDYSEVVDKYFLSKYIRIRERYLIPTLQSDRYAVGLMSSQKVSQQYAEYTDPDRNEKAPVRVYGNSASVTVKIRLITFLSKMWLSCAIQNLWKERDNGTRLPTGRQPSPFHTPTRKWRLKTA